MRGTAWRPKSVCEKPMTPRWAGKGPNARRKAEAYLQTILRGLTTKLAGLFRPTPSGRHAFGPTSASILLAVSINTTRRPSLMSAQNRVVAGSLASHTRSKRRCSRDPPPAASGKGLDTRGAGCLGNDGTEAKSFHCLVKRWDFLLLRRQGHPVIAVGGRGEDCGLGGGA